MAYSLSLLDKSPILDGESAVDALQRTVALAQAAERLGYRRFWLAEHHGFPGLASSAPEILVAHLIARTRRIRIGSGGVLLQHYSPYKVAETFNLLAALAPDRIDLGIGKAPGGLPLSTRALRVQHDPKDARSFEALLAEIALVRERGWATAPDQVITGVNTLAAPVFDHRKALVGSIAIVGATQFIPPVPDPEQIREVVSSAARISRGLTWKD